MTDTIQFFQGDFTDFFEKDIPNFFESTIPKTAIHVGDEIVDVAETGIGELVKFANGMYKYIFIVCCVKLLPIPPGSVNSQPDALWGVVYIPIKIQCNNLYDGLVLASIYHWSLVTTHGWSWMAARKACHPCVQNEMDRIGVIEHRRSNYPCVQRLNGFDFDGFHRMGSDKRIAMASYLWSFFSASGIPDGLDTAVDAVGSLALDIGKGFENLGNLIDNHVIGKQIFMSTPSMISQKTFWWSFC